MPMLLQSSTSTSLYIPLTLVISEKYPRFLEKLITIPIDMTSAQSKSTFDT